MIQERHRHRYEFNNQYREQLETAGLMITGTSPDNHLVEAIELPGKFVFMSAYSIIRSLKADQIARIRCFGLVKAALANKDKN